MRFLIAFLSLFALANAQFGSFFDNMFSGGGGGGHPHESQQRNNPSDAAHYRQRFEQCKSTEPHIIAHIPNTKKLQVF
jgi:hypothetical protein